MLIYYTRVIHFLLTYQCFFYFNWLKPGGTGAKRSELKNNQYIVIVGCGRLGSCLANQLSRDGNSVVIIDKNKDAFTHLSPEFSGFCVDGDATQMAVLKDINFKNTDILIATAHEDNINLMVAQVARKIFGVPHVLARVFDPIKKEIYARLGIDTICVTSVTANMFLRAIADKTNQQEGLRR